ncbi:MAG: hypothetical protein IJ125_00945 [Atopobiaceae bacterium]|nr:hypothetical protein [Atopobiaceae bacterium]
MSATITTTLSKWGNSQGFRLPKEVCDLLGIGLGAEAEVSVDTIASKVTLSFEQPKRKYHRSRKVSIEELCANWQGGKIGEEWGGPDVGAEVIS